MNEHVVADIVRFCDGEVTTVTSCDHQRQLYSAQSAKVVVRYQNLESEATRDVD